MIENERLMLNTFIDSRLEFALKRLDDNPAYQEQCRQQGESEEVAENILHKLEKHERIAVRRHYEGETAKVCFELDEAYLQGLRDCVKLFAFLEIFSVGI